MNKKIIRWILWILVFGGSLIVISILSLSIGPAGIPIGKILSLIQEGKGGVEYSIIFNIRLPRIILGFAIGGALSLAGVILQGMFRNPLVEPYTLGISGGAAVGGALSIILRLHDSLGLFSLPLFGFFGAVTVILLIYSLSIRRGILRMQGLLLKRKIVLEIRDLTCGYDSKIILHDINFHIKGGEITGTIGPNGSGKTTLLRTITRVLRPGKGEVFLEGKNIWEVGFKELAKNIAEVSQDFVTRCMSVEEFILLGRIPYRSRFQFLETKRDMEVARRCMTLTDTLWIISKG